MEQKNAKKKIDSVISDAMFKFAVTSLHKYATINPKEDIVFSPYSIYQGLYSTYLISSVYSTQLQVTVKELIIKEHFTSLYMLIPSSKNKKVETDMRSINLFRLIDRLSTSEGMDILRNILSRAKKVKPLALYTRLTFEIEKYLDMRVLLRELGIEQLLTPDAIPLDNTVAENDRSAHFGNAVHRARVKVTQEDVEAAAVTVISGQEPCSNDIITDMDIKYPFLWFIYDKMYADILYIGVFNKVDKHVSQTKLTGTN
ncbi:uncharacterized protein LOC114937250 [Nylanderia fulva]|uniref:uncharacterized protein LOC114937250 n=1 Tax=Nylanderia fulva TaxID=613905 RepID=UPI0010FBA2FD|nr:uncharacterized protein LOC114937250 [Nylanderia fulva]